MTNLLFENLNYLIVKDFWMIKIWPYFHKSIWVTIFCLFFNFFCSKVIFFESFRWDIILLDFVHFLFKDFKLKNYINYVKYKFSHKIGKVYKWLNMYYSNIKIIIKKKVTTMSIRITLRKFVWIYKRLSSHCIVHSPIYKHEF